MIISSQFDSGNIDCIDCSDPSNVSLAIRADHQSEFYQWFYFRAANVRDIECRYLITNAGGAAYQGGWENYRAVASYDREFWFRVDTSFDGKNLVIEHNSTEDQVYFAYFAPYSMERHADLVAFAQTIRLSSSKASTRSEFQMRELSETLISGSVFQTRSISWTPSVSTAEVLNTAALFCMLCCISSRISDVVLAPDA